MTSEPRTAVVTRGTTPSDALDARAEETVAGGAKVIARIGLFEGKPLEEEVTQLPFEELPSLIPSVLYSLRSRAATAATLPPEQSKRRENRERSALGRRLHFIKPPETHLKNDQSDIHQSLRSLPEPLEECPLEWNLEL